MTVQYQDRESRMHRSQAESRTVLCALRNTSVFDLAEILSVLHMIMISLIIFGIIMI